MLRTAWQHSQALSKGEYSCQDLAAGYLLQAKKTSKENKIFLRLNEEKILAQAKSADNRRAQKKTLSLFDGIPVAVKDNICEKDEICSCGSKMLANYYSPYDATVVERLRKAGLVLFGRCNMDEFAMGSSNENSAFGPVHNPWNKQVVPGGSSGGPAAAVAASLVPLALGSDTGGSVRQPAAFCGIAGLRPSYGRVSRYGLAAFSSSLDQIGPLAKSSLDCAELLAIIEGEDARDLTSIATSQYQTLQGFHAACKNGTLGAKGSEGSVKDKSFFSKITIGHLRPVENSTGNSKKMDASPDTAAPVKTAERLLLNDLRELGCKIIDLKSKYHGAAIALYYIIATAEAASNLARYDGIRYGYKSGRAKNLKEVYTLSRQEGFGAEVRRRILLGNFVLSSGYYDQYYKKAIQLRSLLEQEYTEFFSQANFLLTPTSPLLPFAFGEKMNPLSMYLADSLTVPPSLAGIPAMSICYKIEKKLETKMQNESEKGMPNGQEKEQEKAMFPIGMQFCAPRFADRELCIFTHCLEQVLRQKNPIDFGNAQLP